MFSNNIYVPFQEQMIIFKSISTFLCAGHGKAVRDICYNNDGTQFLSCGYDRWIKLWDTETGMLVQN